MQQVIIVGCGLAGLSAAIECAKKGMDVRMLAPAQSERAQSVMAMGGINAALNTKGQNDSVEQHYEDTIRSGAGISNEKAVKRLTEDAPKIIKWLEDLGTSFTRDANGNVDVRYFGGQKKMRTAYAGARTGKQLVTALTQECRKYEAMGKIKRMTGWRFLSLVLNERKECAGAVFLEENTEKILGLSADAVVLSSGGANRIFGKTTGSLHCDGSVTGNVFLQGVELGNPEMIQYHPTTIDTPVKRMLITEAARGQGGRLYTMRDGEKWYFMEEWYPKFGALMPRDVVSQSIYKVCNEMGLGIEGKNQVFLDITFLPKETIDVKLDEVVSVCERYLKIDPHKEPIPVYPGIHYFMGGIHTDENHATNIPNLYAAGECSEQYHGANRLGGNSLLGAIHGGVVAADSISKLKPKDTKSMEMYIRKQVALEQEKFMEWKNLSNAQGIFTWQIEEKLAQIMKKAMGIYRKEETLKNAYQQLEELLVDCKQACSRGSYYEYYRLNPMIRLAQAMIMGALMRKESRGAHQRWDYSERNDVIYAKTTCVKFERNQILVDFKIN